MNNNTTKTRIQWQIILLAGIILIGIRASAQNVFRPPSEAKTLEDVSRAFGEWAAGRDLSKTKGWKQFKRFEWWAQSRTDAKGKLSFPEGYDQMRKDFVQSHQFKQNGNGNWTPVGPLTGPLNSTDPTRGHGVGRLNCVAFHPQNSNIMWVGASNGGVWKTLNGGNSWFPVGDELPVLRVSDIAVDPTNPDRLYVATGDADGSFSDYLYYGFKDYTALGAGIFKSEDGGNTWQQTNWQSAQVGKLVRRIVAQPNNRLLACSLDGIYRSSDGGQTWQNTLPNNAVWDLKVSSDNPNLCFASTINAPLADTASIWKSTNGGLNWNRVSSLPPSFFSNLNNCDLAIAPGHPNIIYILAANTAGGFKGCYRSLDTGATWVLQSSGPNIMGWFDGGTLWQDDTKSGQGQYDLTIAVDPLNPNRIFAGGVNHWGSNDGGKTWSLMSFWLEYFGTAPHADHHMGRFQPGTNKYFLCTDGGITTTDSLIIDPIAVKAIFDSCQTPCYTFPTPWKHLYNGLAHTEFYRVGISQTDSGIVTGGAQDNGTYKYMSANGWISVNGGDGFETAINSQDPSILYSSVYYGIIFRSDDGGNNFKVINKKVTDTIGDAGDWLTPYHLHPTNQNIVFAGHQNLWKSEDKGDTWHTISAFTDTLVFIGQVLQYTAEFDIYPGAPDNILLIRKKQFYKPSALKKTTDGGVSWTDVSLGLPDSLYMNDVAYGKNVQTAWVVFGSFENGKKVYKTSDGGATWENISFNLPNMPVNTVAVDNNGLTSVIYVGTDLGVWYLADGSGTWQLYSNNLPPVIVSELEIQQSSQSLYASTYGRGIWRVDLTDIPTVGLASSKAAEDKASVKVSPSVNSGNFTLTLSGHSSSNCQLSIIDGMGRQVFQESLQLSSAELTRNYSLSNLNDGVYYLLLSNGKRSKSAKFFVQH